jgi:hypothetical protein
MRKQQRDLLFGLIVCTSSLLNGALASAQSASAGLRPNEYDTAALIYNEQLSALGTRALYPICVSTPSGTSSKPLIQYLRKSGYAVNDLYLCQPNAGPAGGRGKDYPHGMLLFVDKPQRESGGQIAMHVEVTDLTLRPGEHVVATLRRGTYHFKQGEKGEWQISGYTKEYDSADEKERGCKAAESTAASPNR